MGRFKYEVAVMVYQVTFAAREISPKKKYDTIAIVGYISDYGIGKLFPAYLAV